MGERDPSSPGLEPTMLSLGAKRVAAPTANDAPDALIGKRLRHFDVARLLGRGGMGAVYLGHDTSLDRPVALKVLAPEIAHDPEVVARFVREARAQARLRHPNVTQIYFIGEMGGVHFFAMEYVEGPALDTVLERGEPIPWPDAVEYAISAARGLRAALAEGFIHRDVKPSNLMLDKESRVKILDFGLVKSMRGDTELTRDGAIVGSPLYMAPEQGRAESVDHRSDIYSLGCALYHLLTGAPPFSAPSPVGVISMHVTDRAKPVRAIVPEIPIALERVVEKMMAKDPSARPGDDGGYDALITMLEETRPGRREYTGFRTRAMALGVDLVPFVALARFVGLWSGLAAALYFILCSRFGGQTGGKWLFRLQVTDGDGKRIGWKAAAIRFAVFAWAPALWTMMGAAIYFVHRDDRVVFQLGHLSKRELVEPLAYLSAWVLTFIAWLSGFLLAAFHPKHRALHDLLAKTEVTYRVRAPKKLAVTAQRWPAYCYQRGARMKKTIAVLCLLGALTAGCKRPSAATSAGQGAAMANRVVKSDDEWRKLLTDEQFHILREKGTERAFTGAFAESHDKATYVCAACGQELFGSDTKFDSGSGWPSFWKPIAKENVETEEDDSLFMSRTEVRCSRCGGHLGHVFEDGPAPTGLRYCINSGALKQVKK